MADVQHDVIPTNKIHAVTGLGPYADEAARLAATPGSGDVGKVARQTDTGALWELQSHSPLRWQRISGPMPIRTQAGAGAYSCVAADIDACVRMTSGSANAPTIANGLGKVGDSILFRQAGAGLMSVTAGASVTFNPASPAVSAGANSTICLTKVTTGATDIWDVSGKTT